MSHDPARAGKFNFLEWRQNWLDSCREAPCANVQKIINNQMVLNPLPSCAVCVHEKAIRRAYLAKG